MNKQITVISGLLVKDGKIFVQRRSESELVDAHMKWEIPGGKVDFGETIQESLKREFQEETGIEVSVKELLPFAAVNYWKYDWGTQQTLCFVYRCEYIAQGVIPQDHHVYESLWVTPDEARALDSLPGMTELIDYADKWLEN